MGSLANELASAALAPQPIPQVSGKRAESSGKTQSAHTSSQLQSRRLQRNPNFSETSHLVVLRDSPNETIQSGASSGQDAPEASQSSSHDWKSLPLEQGAWLDPETTPPRPRHMEFHDGIHRDLESRSCLYARRQVPATPTMQPVDTETKPPSFFSESFPDGQGFGNVTSESTALSPEIPAPNPQSSTIHMSPLMPTSNVPSTSTSPRLSPSIHPISGSLLSLAPGPLAMPSRSPSCSSLEPPAPRVSAASNECFATEVRIRGWQRVGSYSRGWVAFDVLVTAKSVRHLLTQGIVLQSYKRYTCFLELVDRLCAEAPQHASALPALPPRHTGIWHKYKPTFLETRRRALQRWLVLTLLDPRWGSTRAYREWVLER